MKGMNDGYINHRSTEQRQLILKILQQADGHKDADEIYRQARRKFPRISLSTVYRNLQVLKELGLIEEHQFGNRRYYELPDDEKHHHLVCLSCGRVFEFRCPSTDKLKLRISREEGFKVINTEVRLAGYCPDCQEKMNVKTDENKRMFIKQEVR
jgi:Fe2+ or Zn2+ uptake regulation protein